MTSTMPAATRSIATPPAVKPIQTSAVGGTGGRSFDYVDPAGISQLTVVPMTDPGTDTTYITQIVVVNHRRTGQHVYGTTPVGSRAPVTLDLSADSLKICQLYRSSAHGGRLGGIRIETVKGKSFVVGDVSGTPTRLVDGSPDEEYYYIAGVFGSRGANVDKLGFYLSRDSIVRRCVKDFRYDLSGPAPATTPVTLDTMVVQNTSSDAQVSQIGFNKEVTSTSEWSNTVGLKAGAETEISAKIPLLAEGKVKVSAEISEQYTWGRTQATSHTFAYQTSVNVPPNGKISASVVVLESELKLDFTATYLIERAYSGISSQQIKGTYRGVSAHDVSVTYANVT